jgi:hypothetical protein
VVKEEYRRFDELEPTTLNLKEDIQRQENLFRPQEGLGKNQNSLPLVWRFFQWEKCWKSVRPTVTGKAPPHFPSALSIRHLSSAQESSVFRVTFPSLLT